MKSMTGEPRWHPEDQYDATDEFNESHKMSGECWKWEVERSEELCDLRHIVELPPSGVCELPPSVVGYEPRLHSFLESYI